METWSIRQNSPTKNSFRQAFTSSCQCVHTSSDQTCSIINTIILLYPEQMITTQQQQSFYGHYTRLTVKNYRILLEQNFTAHVPCWWQPARSDYEKDARVLINGVTYTISVPEQIIKIEHTYRSCYCGVLPPGVCSCVGVGIRKATFYGVLQCAKMSLNAVSWPRP